MKTYETIDEAINSIIQTRYEFENNITLKSKTILPNLSNDEIKTILVEKSNGEFGLCLILKLSKKYGGWFIVYPYEEVIMLFPKIYDKYLEVDKHNSKFWKNGNKNR